MPPLGQLAPAKLSLAPKTWMGVLRLYLVVAGGLVLFRIVMLAAQKRLSRTRSGPLAQDGRRSQAPALFPLRRREQNR
jgi:hypothetical protein